ncbi:hypothetical protein [Lewinella sp. W8]|uniref:hypothetical protein n=1 Tax=Lewinella sp. W8 TaxID=2528208 RepID=UPI00106880CC|nr:hypothetical protein [Lewinella sp. W8]MTB53572.1 hypothetical protein [Lewinella sp. W8]
MKKLTLFCAFVLMATLVAGQNVSYDIQRILQLTPEARKTGSVINNPALDSIVLTLAYYGGMPDVNEVNRLLEGAALLEHYQGNQAIREYLINEKIDVLLEAYLPPDTLRLAAEAAASPRGSFLKELSGADLFSRQGKVDLGKIRKTFAEGSTANFSLEAAAAAANDQPAALSSSNLVGNAIAGLSDWISRRAQEELTYSFLTKLREDINRNDLQYLFPNTSNFLPQLDLLNYKAILPSIRKAFVEDLNAVAYNLGNFLDAKNAATFRDPAIYNVFLLYRILDLEMRDVPPQDILAFTYGELDKTRIDTRRKIDLRLGQADTTAATYQGIKMAFDDYTAAIENLNEQFALANNQLSSQLFNPLMTRIDTGMASQPELQTEYFRRAGDLFLPLDTRQLPLKDNYWETGSNPPATGIIASWLRGQEAYEYYEAYPSVARFDQLFGPNATQLRPEELRAAGLTAVREIIASRQKLNAYREQLRSLLDARQGLMDLNKEVTQQRRADELKRQSADTAKARLLADIEAEIAYQPYPALRMLRNLTEEVLPGQKNAKSQLAAIRTRLADWVEERGDKSSPFAKSSRVPEAAMASLPPLQPAIETASVAYDRLFSAMEAYSSSQADTLIRAYKNLSNFETLFGLAQQAFFLLSDDEGSEGLFLKNNKLAVFLTTPEAQQLMGGIGQERLQRVSSFGDLDARGITDFLLDFGLQLDQLSDPYAFPDLAGLPEAAQRRILAVDFISQTVSSLLNAKIFTDPNRARLIDRFPAFADVPVVSQEINELFRLSQTGEYRYAVDNLLNLMKVFNVAPTASQKQQRLTEKRDELRRLLLDYEFEGDRELRAIALGRPSADDLPLLGDRRDEETLRKYSTELRMSVDPYAKEELTNSIRDLKIQRIREELTRVEKRLSKINPARVNAFRENLFRYGTFMADVAAADSPAAFEAALNTIALPVGSSQIKRNRPSSLELGAYFGLALSRERLSLPAGINTSGIEEEAWGAALFVPVGFTYSKRLGNSKSSVTFFGSLLDLGAITAFRLDKQSDDPNAASVDRLPEFRPANVIAPGAHLMYNFPKSPFTLGIGIQDGPSVRKFTTEGSNKERDARAIRGMLTFSVDVPIFRFFNK